MKWHILILAGGSGTRLWPQSREELPKQFLAIPAGQRSLLQQTVLRLRKGAVAKPASLHIIAQERWKSLVKQQMDAIGLTGDVLFEEPEGRNTAPAIALGLARLLHEGAGDDDAVLVCPSDHLITGDDAFSRAIETALDAAAQGYLVTFGVAPREPEPGFGYIKTGAGSGGVFQVERFIEKPDTDRARQLIDSGNCYWNAGIFCFRIKEIIEAYQRHYSAASPLFSAARESEQKMREAFIQMPPLSIDYAVLEHASNIACVTLDTFWSDVGSWDAVYAASPQDENGNAISGNVCLQNSRGTMVRAGTRLVAGTGLDSLLVIDTPDALFVAPRGSAQDLRTLVNALVKDHPDELREAPVNDCSWGCCEIILRGDQHKINRLIILPEKRTPLQYHAHRAKHWIVVKGTASIDCYKADSLNAPNTVTQCIREGESCFIPKGFIHRLANEGNLPVEIIEIQIGAYLGEDDVIRVEALS